MCPAGLGRHPEDVPGAVLVRVLRIGALRPLPFEACVRFLEGIGDVFQKEEAEDDMLVFGRVHAAAQGVGHLPKLGLIAGRGACALRRRSEWVRVFWGVRLVMVVIPPAARRIRVRMDSGDLP